MELSNLSAFFLDLPLYTKIHIPDSTVNDFVDFFRAEPSFDGYNPQLKENTTYRVVYNPGKNSVRTVPDVISNFMGHKTFYLQCVRSMEKTAVYVRIFAEIENNRETFFIEKTGQSPSIADFHISQIRDYNKVLSKEKLREFTKAIGLAANGVGIGSFVYLRRIFESLIEEAHQSAIKEEHWDDIQFRKNRMPEKIDQLKHHLPEFLVDNKILYSILSKGIHELDEKECLEFFNVVRVGIELILDEKLEQYNKKTKMTAAKLQLQSLAQKLI